MQTSELIIPKEIVEGNNLCNRSIEYVRYYWPNYKYMIVYNYKYLREIECITVNKLSDEDRKNDYSVGVWRLKQLKK